VTSERSPPAAPASTAFQRAECNFEGHSRWDFVFLGTVPRSAKSRPHIHLDEKGLIDLIEVAWRPLASAVLVQEKLAIREAENHCVWYPHPRLRNLILRRRTPTGTASGASARLAEGRVRLRVAR
jgi:hypothetical protein